MPLPDPITAARQRIAARELYAALQPPAMPMPDRLLNAPVTFDSGMLRCPRCGYGYLHHDRVTVFERPEDDPDVTVTTMSGNDAFQVQLPNAISRNPSARRDGLTIRFWCESCHADGPLAGPVIELAIAQHKGQTEMFWRFDPSDPRGDDRNEDPGDDMPF